MTEQNPPIWIDGTTVPGEDLKRWIQAMQPTDGVARLATDLKVTEHAGTPNMSVDVAGGACFIRGTDGTYQGTYFVENRGITVKTIAAAHPTNPRKDIVVARVQEDLYDGSTVDAWDLLVVTGTAAGSPVQPTTPDNCYLLAVVDVPATDTAITNSQITNKRYQAASLGGVVFCTSATRPTSDLVEGMRIFETDTHRYYQYSGAAWVQDGLTTVAGVQTYTPTVSQGASSNVSKTVNTASYIRNGPLVTVWVDVNITGSGTAGSPAKVSLPVTAGGPHATAGTIGSGFVFDASSALRYVSPVELENPGPFNNVTFPHDGSGGGQWGVTPNAALANNDVIRFTATYIGT